MRRFLLIIAACALCAVSCHDYDTEIADLQRQLDELATANSKVNDNVAALEKLVEALQIADEVVSFSPVTEGGKVVGYTVTFKNSGSVTVYNSTANVSVGLFEGKYYWMVGGKWLTDADGNKVEACTASVTPQFIVSDGVIKVSLDGGATWTVAGEVGVPVIDEVIDSEESVVFVLAGGTRITLVKVRPLTLTLSTYSLTMEAGGGRTISYEIAGGDAHTEIILYTKDSWTANLTKTDHANGMIQVKAPATAGSSSILVFVSDGQGRSVVKSLAVTATN
ncbi:MAG: hypothetical protein J6X89_06450 [Bacteroidales bacterium]|nr:hypothetical protein [Bacteroidales bacterium]